MKIEYKREIERVRTRIEGGTSRTDSEGSRRKSLKDILGERPQGVIVRQGKGITRKGYEDRV